MVETTAEQRASEQVPPEAPSMEHAAPKERRDPEPRQEAPEQSTATPKHTGGWSTGHRGSGESFGGGDQARE
jgi:hypothetical protein